MSAIDHSQLISAEEPPQGAGSASDNEGVATYENGAEHGPGETPNWVRNASRLWQKRRMLARTAGVALALGLAIAFLLPKRYESSARIMPPSNSMGGTALLAALAGHAGGSLGALGALAGSFLGGGGNTALFVDLLRSGSISGPLIDRFDLQHVYHTRYRVDAAKRLAHFTKIVDDRKSGVITLTVTDTDPVRARDIAQGYLDGLNQLVNRTNTSSAHQERLFIEKRLQGVRESLEKAQERLSEFSSTHSTIDIKEQARSMVDAAARMQAQLIIEESGLDSLRQVYGDENVRVRSAKARIGVLQAEIVKMSGSSKALPTDNGDTGTGGTSSNGDDNLYPPLRQLPLLAVPYANLYREVQVQESVYELLTQQYELARIQEAKDVPVVSVIDAPGIPEKKSFPPRLLMALLVTITSVAGVALFLLVQYEWVQVPAADPRKALLRQIGAGIKPRLSWIRRTGSVQ
ncbi:MAG TPA: Wzz/FepE/Etk N-terminal domain-containing protein [Terracidiphilus sp.]|jgi:capsule polysaccharide export protein KpsE/RkpR